MGSSSVKVAVLGPKGTFSEKAARGKWKEADIVLVNQLSEIFTAVEEGEADYGIVPTEDSVVGDVFASLTLLKEHDLYITGEAYVEVRHCLLGKGRIEDLKKIGSHPQALSHCRRYLDTRFPELPREQTLSTAEAARRASEDSSFGAIADEECAQIYGLNILARGLHDYGSNTTRLLEISKQQANPADPAKTSIIVWPSVDKPGVLHEITGKFTFSNINLTRIVSYPFGEDIGEYIFYIDFEGSQNNPQVQEALRKLRDSGDIHSIRIFGSYDRVAKKKETEPEIGEIDPSELIKATFEFWCNEEDD